MEDATSSHPDHLDSSLMTTMEFDLLDELLLGGDWSYAPPPSSDYSSGFYFSGTTLSATAVESPSYLSNLPGFEESTSSGQEKVEAHSLDDDDDDDQATPGLFPCPPTPKQLHHSHGRNQPAAAREQPRQDESRAPSSALVSVTASQIPSVKERLTRALAYIKESYKEGEVLIQIWVPIKRGNKQVLTTSDQPFSLDPTSQRLGCYRTVSVNYLFSAEDDSKDDLGLPGRVFLGKLPEWTPDVRLFRRFEYPRVGYAQHYDVRGSIGIPVFDRSGGNSCLGVVEVVMTTEKVNYGQEIANMCRALQAVDLCGGDLPRFDRSLKDKYDSYKCALPEIAEVLRAICEIHNLPLGQAWMHCIHQGKKGSRHTSDNYRNCLSTVDNSCFVNDPSVKGFHEACSEHHLFKGQGVAGKAFMTNKPCFSPDITAFQKTEYPLSHHAKVFNLRGAVAIRLRSILAAKVDFVLEFFLPLDCVDHKEQNYILNSMSMTIQQTSRNLRAVTAKELQDDCTLIKDDFTDFYNKNTMRDLDFAAEKETRTGVPLPQISGTSLNTFNGSSTSEGKSLQGFSYESRRNTEGTFSTKNRSSNLSFHKEELDSFNNNHDYDTEPLVRAGKERKYSKPEKMISLKVLQKYFAGSLKDAAKDLGVCPTTLKRICRQHGITRWPSRKIKKVGHSLKKLQKVIDSVQGIDKAFQLSSLCASIEKPFGMDFALQNALEPTDLVTSKVEDSSDPQGCLFDLHTSVSNSASSSCSQNSTQSHICSSAEKLHSDTSQGPVKEENNEYGTYNSIIKSATEEVDLNLFTQQPSVLLSGSHSLRPVSAYPLVGTWMGMDTRLKNLLGVKASYGEDKVRFRFQPKWSLQDLRQEIAMRFSINNPDMVELKYLDDDSECVLLTCDADLQECVDVHQSTNTLVMKFFVNHAGQAGGS